MPISTAQLLAVARGDLPADLLLANCRIVNVFTGEIEEADIAIVGDRIAGVGRRYTARKTINVNGAYVSPGLIDAHVHIESSLCTPPNFAAAVVPRGVTTVVADPHEIANVQGAAGVRYMATAAKGLPLRVVQMAPSCVPATDMATAGAALNAADLKPLIDERIVHGLAEVMNFPGVIANTPDVRAKIDAFTGTPIDGHAPGVTGLALNAYVASGIGSDHECVTPEEAKERLSLGLYLLIREATNAQNMDALLKAVTPANSRRVCFCTDDRTPADLLGPGGIDDMVRRAIVLGVPPIEAIRMATLNTAECFSLNDRGAIAPGRLADLFIFDEFHSPRAKVVFAGGVQVTAVTFSANSAVAAKALELKIDPAKVNLSVPVVSGKTSLRVIGHLPNQLVSEERILPATIVDELATADVSRDILKMATLERHHGTGNIGVGFIQGFGLREGAIAGTVAHDHHNLVVIGANDAAMLAAIEHVCEMKGGLVVVDADGQLIASLPLPVAGLMSDRPITEVRDAYDKLLTAAKALGSPLHDPFMAMSFMALEVIPKLKLTDKGLVDVERFGFVDLWV